MTTREKLEKEIKMIMETEKKKGRSEQSMITLVNFQAKLKGYDLGRKEALEEVEIILERNSDFKALIESVKELNNAKADLSEVEE